jgi:hypothetical protein
MTESNSTLKEQYESNNLEDEPITKRLKKDISNDVESSIFEENKSKEDLVDKNKRCSGCYPIFQNNQLGHMEYGGCMYFDDFISEPSDTEEDSNSEIHEGPSKKKSKTC